MIVTTPSAHCPLRMCERERAEEVLVVVILVFCLSTVIDSSLAAPTNENKWPTDYAE